MVTALRQLHARVARLTYETNIDHCPIPNNDLLSFTLAISPGGQEVFSSTLAGQL